MYLAKINSICKLIFIKNNLKYNNLIFFSILLCSCASSDNLIKLSEVPPDEFAVIRKDPLEIPPNFNLRPPGKLEKNSSDSSKKAKEVFTDLIGNKKKNNTSDLDLTPGDSILLEKTGFTEKNSSIREVLTSENSQELLNKGRIEKLVESLVGKRNENILNPSEERKRNQEQVATGENFLKSQKPVIIRRLKK